mgnify:CR=1 FL=1
MKNDLNSVIQRTFVIGDEWLYYKLYCGPKTADEILTEVLKPLTEKLLEEGVIDKWFFIRYSDPKLHLRIRFHYIFPENVSVIINSLNTYIKEYLKQDLIYKIQVDTYERELERYGLKSIEHAENLFFHDSQMILDFLDVIEGDDGEIIRWLFAMKAIDTFLTDFSYNDKEKLNLLNGLKDGYGKEFGMNKMLKLQLDKKYRDQRQLINEMFDHKFRGENVQVLIDILEKKSKNTKEIIQNILTMQSKEILKRPLNDLLGSYIHMLMNRLFKSKQRMHEMVIYDFLYRYYRSEMAKRKYKPELVNNS